MADTKKKTTSKKKTTKQEVVDNKLEKSSKSTSKDKKETKKTVSKDTVAKGATSKKVTAKKTASKTSDSSKKTQSKKVLSKQKIEDTKIKDSKTKVSSKSSVKEKKEIESKVSKKIVEQKKVQSRKNSKSQEIVNDEVKSLSKNKVEKKKKIQSRVSREVTTPKKEIQFQENQKEKNNIKDEIEDNDFGEMPKFTIKIESIKARTSADHLSQEELKEIDEDRKRRGQELADKIFELSNKIRTKDLNTYVETIQDSVRGKFSEENQAILRTACNYFTEKYKTWCRDRGKSIQLLDNIVHRTGKETEEFLAKLLRGFDVKEMSRELWNLDLNKKFAELRIARQQMYDLTNGQVQELREEYNSIPAQELAELIHDALNQTNLTDEPRPDVETIKYILKGRSTLDNKQIEFQYNEKYHFVREGEGEPELKDVINTKLSTEAASEVLELLKGFNAREIADQIHQLLLHCSEASEVVEQGLEIHPDFAGNFRRDYSKATNIERELRAKEEIGKIIEYLTPAQFKNVCRHLETHYSEELSQQLYRCNHEFNPRQIAIEYFRALNVIPQRRLCKKSQDYLNYEQMMSIKSRFSTSTHNEITKIIEKWANEQKAEESYKLVSQAILPLQYLDPNQMFYVREWFYICTGVKLEEYTQEKIKFICQNEVPKYVTNLLKIRLSGQARLALNPDLFDLFSSAEQRRQNFLNLEPHAKQIEQGKKDAEEIQKILDDRVDRRRNDNLIKFLQNLDSVRSNEMEKAFLELSNGDSLLNTIHSKVSSKEVKTIASYLLTQFDIIKEAKKINENLDNLLNLFSQTPKAITAVLQQYKSLCKKDLFSLVRTQYKDKDSIKKRLLLEMILFTPNVLKIHQFLKSKMPLNEEMSSFILRQLTRSRLDVLALESSYNQFFGKFIYCQDVLNGTFFQQLRVLATKGIISRKLFASAILLLENVEPSLPLTIQNHLNESNLVGVTILRLHSLLREFKDHLRILQKAFNALSGNKTLRDTIYELRIPLEIKNKTLLLLDGYDPDKVAREIIQVIHNEKDGEEIGRKVTLILSEKIGDKDNPRIPAVSNWTSEMYHQIRVSYELLTAHKLVTDLLKANVPAKGDGVNNIAFKLYGEVSKRVIDIRKLVCERSSIENLNGVVERKIVQVLSDLEPALRERAVNMYDAFYSEARGSLSLLEEVKTFSNKVVRERGEYLIQEILTWDIPY